ncbi:ATP-binding protein [Sphingobacterium sp. SRCM116780]|uniref:tetratricopeptide repeat-containing sensor histidine kinase n=1 Tax=Sphingobacterium sp. SRCM116780 TaxID=2907623 RepID=UPI001F18A7E7|nr:ATP-binding protein [Sphingobacterium sp. SRCM116780]UIR57060.1 ATP-binding protein [Sphingobacterium sp. SRCM116780]
MKVLSYLKIFVFILLLFGCFTGKGQSDSALKKKSDSLEMEIRQSRSINQEKKLIVELLKTNAYRNSKFSIQYAEKILKQNRGQVDSLYLTKVYLYYGVSLIADNQYEKADRVHKEGILFAEKIHNKEVLNDLVLLKVNEATLFGEMGYRSTQLQKMIDILPLIHQLKDDTIAYGMYTNFGLAYYELREYKRALEYLYLARPLINKNTVRYHERGYNEILLASVYKRLGQRDSVIKYTDLAEKQINESLTPGYLARFYTLKGLSFLYKNNPNEALKYINKGKEQALKINVSKEEQYATLAEIDYYTYSKNWNKAIYLLEMLLTNKNETLKEDALVKLGEVYEKSGNYKKSIETYRKLAAHLVDEKKGKESLHFQELDYIYKFKDKVLENERLKASNEKSLVTSQRNQLFIAVLLILLVIILIVIIFRNKTQLRERLMNEQKLKLMQANLEEEKQKYLIDEMTLLRKVEDKERNRIANDLHDSIGGLLSSIKILIYHFKEQNLLEPNTIKNADQILDYINESKQELNRIVYNLTPLVVERFGLIEAIKQYCKKIQSDRLKIQLQLVSFPPNLSTDSEITLYRVVQEAVQNIFKHADATEILIQIQTTRKGVVVITIEDNGIGMDVDKINLNTGLGIKSLYSRVHHLKGSIKFVSKPNGGTSLYIICKPN